MSLAAYCGVCGSELPANSTSCPACAVATLVEEPPGQATPPPLALPAHNWRRADPGVPVVPLAVPAAPEASATGPPPVNPRRVPKASGQVVGPGFPVAGEGAPAQRGRLWLGAALLLAAAAAVAAFVLLSGGSPRTPSEGSPGMPSTTISSVAKPPASAAFTVFRDRTLTALAPQGWPSRVVSETASAEQVHIADPRSPGVGVTISVFRASDTALARAMSIERSAVRQPGFRRFFWGVVRFPGGPQVWRLVYAVRGRGFAVYTFAGCSPARTVVVEGEAPQASLERLTPEFGFLASSVRPLCQ